MKRAKFIINPSSGKQNFLGNIESIAGCLILNQIVNKIDVVYTKHEQDAKLEAGRMKKGEYDFVVTIGGDGTLSDVVNGVIEGRNETPIAIVSSGMTNDFASSLGVPVEKDAFCKMILDFKLKDIDVGRVNNGYFINVIAGGLWADVGNKVDRESRMVLGKVAYLIEGARELPKHGFKAFKLYFDCEEFTSEEEVYFFAIANSKNIAGLKNFVPDAKADDGLLDVVIFKKMDFGEFSTLLFRFLQGEHLKHPSVKYFQTKKLKVSSLINQEISIDCDGERCRHLPIEVEACTKAVKVIIPEDH